jgi:ubiquinone biosynthesis protein Coq4
MEQVLKLLSESCGVPITRELLTKDNRYYENDLVREWSGYMMLRPQSSLPLSTSFVHMEVIKTVVDKDKANAIFAEARKTDPVLEAFFAERHIPRYRDTDFSVYPKGTLGGALYEDYVAKGMNLDLADGLPVDNDYDFFMCRSLAIHDIEHILTGSQANEIGEIIPQYLRYGFTAKYLPPELAPMLNAPLYMVTLAHLSSAMLHTPEIFPVMMESVRRGWEIGRDVGPYMYVKYEDYYHMSIPDVRAALSIGHADDFDPSEASRLIRARNQLVA